MKYTSTLLSLPLLAQAASSVYTGFAYGAFWSDYANTKYKDDFLDGFALARNLTTSIPFDSARIFTCITPNTANDPTEAFDAAVESKTNLLLGFYIMPNSRDGTPDKQIANEMLALEKGFQKHGQKLSDLVIGLSVGNEDIYHWEDVKDAQSNPSPGNSAAVISTNIDRVRKLISSSSFSKYMQGKPIGHVDTATHAAKVKGADFIGVTAYPWWAHKNIEDAKASFMSSLEDVKKGAGNTPVWIAEMGWPFQSDLKGFPEASAQTMQRYWTEVACSVLGQYTTFWFQLLKDSEVGQPDWVGPSTTVPAPSGVVEYTTITSYSTVTVTNGGSYPNSTTTVHKTWCVTQADVFRDGRFMTVAGGPPVVDGKCSSPPPYNGHP
ncbi:glycoside hydrolase family 17 protein, partial [Plenodomus tracheiphilus IPT5]